MWKRNLVITTINYDLKELKHFSTFIFSKSDPQNRLSHSFENVAVAFTKFKIKSRAIS
jgi:hypothetical protein